MSDEEIRNLLDLGAQDLESQAVQSGADGPRATADDLSGEELWAAGRRQRNRGRAWIGGLGAAAAAASILGIVWAQSLAGGDAAPPPADSTPDTIPGPTVAVERDEHGEPFFARFERSDNDASQELSGASVPATLEDLQGTWIGPDGEVFAFDGDEFTASKADCILEQRTVAIAPDGRLSKIGPMDASIDDDDCLHEDQPAIPWQPAINAKPMLSIDGETLLVSGLDGTNEEPRVRVALSLGPVDDSGFTWADVPARTGVTPITLGGDFALLTSGSSDDATLDSISELNLAERPGAAQTAQSDDVEPMGYPGTCPQVMESSLRSDGLLLVGTPAPFTACAEGSDAPLPAAEPSPAVLALLRSGPMVGFDGETMVISGTIPESLLADAAPPLVDDTAPTSEDPTTDAGEPTGQDLPLVVGQPAIVVLAESEWEHSGTLSALTTLEATDRRWRMVDLTTEPPAVGRGLSDEWGLTFDGTSWRYRECGIDVSASGSLENGQLILSGEVSVHPSPDPDASCELQPLLSDEWAELLSSKPRLFTDGQVLVISGGLDERRLAPYSKGLAPDAVDDPSVGPHAGITADDLTGGLTELPVDVAINDLGLSDVGDAMPEHDTTLRLDGQNLLMDTSCGAVESGPAWIHQAGPESTDTQLFAALPLIDCTSAPGAEAQLWREMLAHGAFAYRFGDYLILDGWATASLTPPG